MCQVAYITPWATVPPKVMSIIAHFKRFSPTWVSELVHSTARVAQSQLVVYLRALQ